MCRIKIRISNEHKVLLEDTPALITTLKYILLKVVL